MMRLTIPHRFDFGSDRELVGSDLQRPEAWDSLRLQTDGAFAMPGDRAGYERLLEQRTDIAARARAITRFSTRRRSAASRHMASGARRSSSPCTASRPVARSP